LRPQDGWRGKNAGRGGQQCAAMDHDEDLPVSRLSMEWTQ
jgi:hypothetical protein